MGRKNKKVQKYSSPNPGSKATPYSYAIQEFIYNNNNAEFEQQMLNIEAGGGRTFVTEYTGEKLAVRGPKGHDGLYYFERRKLDKNKL